MRLLHYDNDGDFSLAEFFASNTLPAPANPDAFLSEIYSSIAVPVPYQRRAFSRNIIHDCVLQL